MSVVIKVTDMSDNSVKFYNDMIEFMKDFYSEEDYNADCEDYQDREDREKYFDELFDKERMEEFDTFWGSYDGAIETWWKTFQKENFCLRKPTDGKLIFEWFNRVFEPLEVKEENSSN